MAPPRRSTEYGLSPSYVSHQCRNLCSFCVAVCVGAIGRKYHYAVGVSLLGAGMTLAGLAFLSSLGYARVHWSSLFNAVRKMLRIVCIDVAGDANSEAGVTVEVHISKSFTLGFLLGLILSDLRNLRWKTIRSKNLDQLAR